jgi:hypothetical protein
MRTNIQLVCYNHFPFHEWKWEVVTIDFITKIPRIVKQHDSIMVVVDKLTKFSHFILVKLTHKELTLQIFT